jgi:hypothetical protein
MGIPHDFINALSSIQNKPVPALTQELMKPQGVRISPL